MIDYSKWDKLELSDDSDVEVHPNVDKNSFIRWKQRDIHEKRTQRNQEIKTILVQSTMYAELNKRVDYLLDTVTDFSDVDKVMATLDARFDAAEKFDYDALLAKQDLRKGLKDLEFAKEEIDATPPYNEMVEDLLLQVRDGGAHTASGASGAGEGAVVDVRTSLSEHRKKIDAVLAQQSVKLDDLLQQKANLISSDDYHTGWDSSFVNKTEETAPKETVVETIHQPGGASGAGATGATGATSGSAAGATGATASASGATGGSGSAELDLEVRPETLAFSTLKDDEMLPYLSRHPDICTEHQKDSLIMTAFDLQLEGKTAEARLVVYHSLILQYVDQLAGGAHATAESRRKAVALFLGKLSDSRVPVRQGFLQDVENTVAHIIKRCEYLKEEQAQLNEEEALIQLRALDEGTELSVSIPEHGTAEYEVFATLPEEMQEAVKTGSLDRVNEVFASYKVERAEEILEVFNQCGVIGVSGVLESEGEFRELQAAAAEAASEPHESSHESSHQLDTADVVD